MKKKLYELSFLIVFAFCLWVTEASADNLKRLNIYKKNQEVVQYYVDIADTYDKQKMGLMYVKKMPKNQGMFFIYGKERNVGIWMKNTFIPLDIIFIDKNGIITEIVQRPDTRSRTTTTSNEPSKYVLEINLGEAKRNDIQVGDFVSLSKQQ